MKVLFPEKAILIVDDEEDTLDSDKMALQFEGISNIILCLDSEKCVDILARNEIPVALIDLLMPGVTGLEILKHIREKYPHISVIVVTASNNVTSTVDCMKAGAFDITP